MTEKPGIYCIRHTASGKVYVGSATNISKRWSRHRKDLALNRHSNPHLQAAWNRYGSTAFVFEVLEYTASDLTVLTAREQHWIDVTDCANTAKGYNLCPQARSSRGRPRGPLTLWERAHIDEIIRMSAEVRRGKGKKYLPRGKPSVKLTADQVRAIREAYGMWSPNGKGRKHGTVTVEQLAQQYGVHIMTVCDILRGKTWVNV